MKVTIVTVVFNCAGFIEDCIQSVLSQQYQDIEYLVIDGGSTDGTLTILKKYSTKLSIHSESDLSMYDGLNKGIGYAKGDIIGMLNADDMLASPDIISSVVNCFRRTSCDLLYGNLNFICRADKSQVTRIWNSGIFNKSKIHQGWMAPHPTMYIKKEIFLKYGKYSLSFGNCADYELILRLFYKEEIRCYFLNRVMVIMRAGGMTNNSLISIWTTLRHDYRAMILHRIPLPLFALILKKMRKIRQLKYV